MSSNPYFLTSGGQANATAIVKPMSCGETPFVGISTRFIELCDQGEQMICGEINAGVEGAYLVAEVGATRGLASMFMALCVLSKDVVWRVAIIAKHCFYIQY